VEDEPVQVRVRGKGMKSGDIGRGDTSGNIEKRVRGKTKVTHRRHTLSRAANFRSI